MVDRTVEGHQHPSIGRFVPALHLDLLEFEVAVDGKLLSEDQPVQILTDRNEYETGDPVRIKHRHPVNTCARNNY